jgi:hypothetical protein
MHSQVPGVRVRPSWDHYTAMRRDGAGLHAQNGRNNLGHYYFKEIKAKSRKVQSIFSFKKKKMYVQLNA